MEIQHTKTYGMHAAKAVLWEKVHKDKEFIKKQDYLYISSKEKNKIKQHWNLVEGNNKDQNRNKKIEIKKTIEKINETNSCFF